MSLKYLFHIIAVCFCFYATSLFAQIPKIKRITKITYTYNIREKEEIDTTIQDFDKNGKEIIKPSKFEPDGYIHCGVTTTYPIKEVTLDSTKEKITQKVFYSDSTTELYVKHNYKDSTVYLHLKNTGITLKQVLYLKNGKTIKMTTESDVYDEHQIMTVKRNNFFVYKSEEKDTGNNNIVITKYVGNKLFKTKKTYTYNSATKKYFLSIKEKYNRIKPDKRLLRKMERSYHEYHKVYFKTLTKYKYNSYGQIISDFVKDGSKTPEKKTLYFYEYY